MEEKQWEISTEVQEILGQERCIKQLVQNVEMNVKFHSSQPKASQFTAENAIGKEEGFNSLNIETSSSFIFLFIFYSINQYYQ